MLCSRRLSGRSAEVEGRGAGGTEVDGHGLCVIRVDVQAGRGQHCIERDGAAQVLAQGAAAEDAVGVELEGSAGLLTLEHVFDHPVGEGGVLVGHVDRCGAGAIAEAGDVAAEGDVLAGGLANGGYVDLSAADLEAPVADLADGCELGVGNLELVGSGDGAVVGDGDGRTAGGGGNLQHAGCRCVGNDVIGGGQGDTGRQGAGAGAAGLAVDDAELDGVADLEVQVGSNGDLVATGVHVGLTERSGGSSGFVVKSAGRAGQNGGGHWLTEGDVMGGHCPA